MMMNNMLLEPSKLSTGDDESNWLEHYNRVSSHNKWDDETKILAINKYLPHEVVYWCLSQNFTKFSIFEQEFKTKFVKKMDADKLAIQIKL